MMSRHLSTSLLFSLKSLNKNSNPLKLAKRTFLKCQPLLAGNVKDYKPGPYPKTNEERIAAAKKYGLRFVHV